MFRRWVSGLMALVLVFGLVAWLPQRAEAASTDSAMKASDDLVSVLKKIEGFSAKPYWDYAQWTVGYGTRCPDDKLEEYKKNGISKAAAEVLLKKELAKAETAVNKFATANKREFKQNEFDALVSFTYNCGTGWTTETTGYFYNAVKQGDKSNDFLYAMALWSTAGGEFILIDRRMCEADMYINGVYNAPGAGEEKPYPDNFRWVFLDGNGGEAQYRIFAFDSDNPIAIKTKFSKTPTGFDENGKEFTYKLAGWYTEKGKKVKTLDASVTSGQVLYAKWKDPEGNIVEIPKGQPPETDEVLVTGDVVNVRSGPGTYYPRVGEVTEGMVLSVSEVYTNGGHIWGKTPVGWVSLTYTNYGKAPVITNKSINAVVPEGEKATISLEVKGTQLQYQWYYKNKNAKNFSLTEAFTGNTYQVAMSQSRSQRQVYCVITDKNGYSVKTDTITLGMAVSILEQPVSVSPLNGEKAEVKVTATGDGLKYQWYYKNKNATKFSLTTAFSGNKYWVEMSKTRSGRQVYCVITDQYGNSVKTDTVTLGNVATIKKQPVSVNVKNGETVTVNVSASGDGLRYAWYYKNKKASKFSLTTAFSEDAYWVEMNKTRSGRQVYCVITDRYGNFVKTKTVTIGMGVSISKQPVSVSPLNGEKAEVKVTATGDGMKYQWYYKNKNATKFSLTTAFSGNKYWVEMNKTRSGRQVYCVITDRYGNSVKTDTVTLGNAVKILAQPVSVSAPIGGKATVKLDASGDGLRYQWYYKNKDATKFSLTTSFTGNTYWVSMNEMRAGRQVYCVITDRYGNSVKTDVVTIDIAVKITKQPVSQKVAEGEKGNVSVSATGEGLRYQWYFKDKGASEFSLTKSYTGKSYQVVMRESRSGRQVYCVITDRYGSSVKTKTVTLKMK